MIPRFHSILSRIAWLHVVALGTAAVALPAASYVLLRNTAEAYEDKVLKAHADQIADHLHIVNGAWRLDLPDDLKTFYAHGFDGFSYAVLDSGGRLVAAAPREEPIGPSQGIVTARYFERARGNAIYFGATIPERINGHTVFIQIGQDGAHPDVIVDDIILDFLRRVGWFTVPIILIVLAIDIGVVRLALRPVLAASRQALTISPGRIDFRLPTANLPSEIEPLVDAFNRVLDRLELGFRIHREFTADAAHELRTPLSVLRARIDAFHDQEAMKPLRRDVDVMSRIVAQLLESAELEGALSEPDEVMDLRSACERVVEHMAPIVAAKGQRAVLRGTSKPVLIKGNTDMVFRAIRNLAENASKYSPHGAQVEIRIEDEGVVRVIDEGPGIPEANRDAIFRRFWRHSRSRSDGAGLGLSIVSRIVEVHRGKIEVENIPERGTMFVIRFPTLEATTDRPEGFHLQPVGIGQSELRP